jgi:hypothetical protein
MRTLLAFVTAASIIFALASHSVWIGLTFSLVGGMSLLLIFLAGKLDAAPEPPLGRVILRDMILCGLVIFLLCASLVLVAVAPFYYFSPP